MTVLASGDVEIRLSQSALSKIENDLNGSLKKSTRGAGASAGEGFAKDFGSSFKGAIGGIAKSAAALFAAGVAGAGTLAALGTKAAHTFEEVGGEVRKLQKFTGGSAESMSKLRFAAQQTGIDVDKLGSALGLLSKHAAAGDKTMKLVGVSAKDAQGKFRPLEDVLGDVAEKFKNLPPGIEKNRLALAVFGRSGADLLPFLNKGRAGLAELGAEAKKFGLVLTQDNLDAIKKNVEAHRNFTAAMQGLQVQVGAFVLPVFTRLVEFATRIMQPAIQTLGNVMQNLFAGFNGSESEAINVFDRIALAAGKAFRTIVETAESAARTFILGFEGGQAAFIGVFDELAFKAGTALGKVVDFVRNTVIPIFQDKVIPIIQDVGKAFAQHIGVISVGALVAVASQVGPFADAIAALGSVFDLLAANPLIAVLAALAALFIFGYKTSSSFRDAVDELGRTMKDQLVAVFEKIKPLLPKLLSAITDIGTALLPLIPAFGALLIAILPIVPVFAQLVTIVAQFLAALPPEVILAVAGALLFLFSEVVAVIAIVAGLVEVAKLIAPVFGPLGDFFVALWEGIKSVFSGAVNFIQTLIDNWFRVLLAIFTLGQSEILGFVVRHWGEIQSFIGNVIGAIVGFVASLPGKVIGFFVTTTTGVINELRKLPGQILNVFTSLPGQMIDIGKRIIEGLIEGIKRFAHLAVEAVKGVVGGVVKGAKSLLGIGSPSKVFAEIGTNTLEGFVLGLRSQQRAIRDELAQLVNVPAINLTRVTGPGGAALPRGTDGTQATQVPATTNHNNITVIDNTGSAQATAEVIASRLGLAARR